MKQSFKHIDIKPFESALGAEIIGVDLSNALDDTVFEEVERAFNTYSLLLFRSRPSHQKVRLRSAADLASSNTTCLAIGA